MIRPTSSFLAAITFAVIAAWCTAAAAAPKLALPAIDGDLTGSMREAVAEALDGDELTVIGERETNRAVDKLGELPELYELSPKQAKKLGTALAADAVVTASYDKKGKTKFLRFKLFVNGKKLRGFKVQFKNESSPKFRDALRAKIVERLGEVSADDEAEDDAPRNKRSRLAKARGDAGEDDEDPNPKARRGGDDDDDDDADDDQGDDEDGPRKGKRRAARAADDDEDLDEPAIVARMEPKHAANRVAIRLDTGVSVAGRSLQFTKRANFPEGPRKFKSSPVPGARLEMELYPLAFVMPKSLLAGLGAEVEYDKTLKLNLQTTAEPGVAIPVDQTHFAVGGRFRIPFGRRATSPTMTLGFDYGARRWKADRSALMDPGALDLPDTHYKYLAPVLGFRIPFGKTVAFVASGEALIVRSAGPIQKADSYGKAKVYGGGGEAGFDVVIANRVALRLVGEFTQIGFTFLGAGGDQANNRDGDPTTKDVGGAADRVYGGTATLAVLY